MNRILITGATGNVGKEVVQSLVALNQKDRILAGVRNPGKVRTQFDSEVELVPFDFEDDNTFLPALEACDILFLLRPPQLADVQRYFVPILEAAKSSGIKHIVFLSVQGVEQSTFIPHYKIERLIVKSGIPYTFLRPAYFMQNFTTTLQKDIVENRLIYLPAGKARFTIIDTKDVGAVCAAVLTIPGEHINKSYDLTNTEKLSFEDMAMKICHVLGYPVRFVSPSLLAFFIRKRKENVPVGFILVMILLHYFPRFKKEPDITDCVKSLTGTEAKSFDTFLSENRSKLTKM